MTQRLLSKQDNYDHMIEQLMQDNQLIKQKLTVIEL